MHTLLLGLMACTGDNPSETGPDQTEDTGTDTDTDTGQPPPQTGTLYGNIVLPVGAAGAVPDLKLGLVGIEFSDGDTTETIAITPVEIGGSYTLALTTPPPAALLTELEDTIYPGLMGAPFLLLAFSDTDDNDRFIPGERIAGGSLSRLVFWLEGDVPDGFVEGWNLIDTGLSGPYETGNCLLNTTSPIVWRSELNRNYPAVYGFDEPVDIPLYGVEVGLSIGGVAVGLDAGDRLSLVPYQTLYEDPAKEPLPTLAELSLKGGTFSADFREPLEARYDVSPDPAWGYGLAFGVVYQDADSSGDYTPGEASTDASLCVNNSLAALRYTSPVANYRGWRLMECYQVQAGWRIVTRLSSGNWVRARTDEEAAGLVIDRDICSL